MPDYNEVRRKEDYVETQQEVRNLLAQISAALDTHEAKATHWGFNGDLLAVKQDLLDALAKLTPKPGAKEVNDALTGLAETVKEIRKEEKQ